MQAVNKNYKSITKPITELKKGDKIKISQNDRNNNKIRKKNILHLKILFPLSFPLQKTKE